MVPDSCVHFDIGASSPRSGTVGPVGGDRHAVKVTVIFDYYTCNGSFGTRTNWCVLNKELCTCDWYFLWGCVQSNLSKPCFVPKLLLCAVEGATLPTFLWSFSEQWQVIKQLKINYQFTQNGPTTEKIRFFWRGQTSRFGTSTHQGMPEQASYCGLSRCF